MGIDLSDERRSGLVARLQGFFLQEFDEELSVFRAEQILDFLLASVGPSIYNQAVQDARKYMQDRLDDLDGEVFELDAV